MTLLNPKKTTFDQVDAPSAELLKKTIDFFEKKGKNSLKNDDHERRWYDDFLAFQKQEKLFANFLTPAQYGNGNTRWDTYRNCYLNEILGFYGLNYWYTWQVTILGLGPIWMSNNDGIKIQTAQLLDQGGIFAYGLSEKEHGADIYASSMTLHPKGSAWLARGRKYYIGNGNEAAFVSVFGKIAPENDYVFFVAESKNKHYKCLQNVVNSQNYVAEIELDDYPVTEKEILLRGSEAWDACLNTVNIGKFNLGWASIGMCTHALYESLNHASKRCLFDHTVTEFVHIRQLFVDAYCRLAAMRAFAFRAADYMRSASLQDRRYLLYNPVVKMKVTSQGEEVINLLWDVIAAKGFEKDTFFEAAARDIRALPKLEGTIHVNMALIIKFMANYFFKAVDYPEMSTQNGTENDDFLFRQGPARGLSKIRFHDYKKVYNRENTPNIKIFRKQIRLLKMMLILARPDKEQAKDFDFLLNLGELFTLVVYGQLIIENKQMLQFSGQLLDQIFDFMVRDFSKYALLLYSKTSATNRQRKICKRMIKRPHHDETRYQAVLKEVYSLTETYEMNP
ncbi:MAG: acyl-CoA dehydrogenase [Calditrichaeota bacterium]|nr:acyl-CoA dehydrogenase [Calditrichota bacterium]